MLKFTKSIITALALAALLAPLPQATADDSGVGTSERGRDQHFPTSPKESRSAELTPDALAILQAADLADTKDQDALKKLASQSGVCERLAELLFPDTDQLIANLGADSFDIREAATQALSIMGEKIIPRIKPLTSSKDPEVKMRAKQIMKAIKNGDIPHSYAMDNALFVILNSKENPPSNIKFLQFYFKRLPDLPKTLRDLLPAATERSADRPELADAIADLIRNNCLPNLNDTLYDALKKTDPQRYPILLKKIKAWSALMKMDLDVKADEFGRANRHSYGDIRQVENKIKAIPGYKLIKDETIKFLIASKYGFLVTVGVILLQDDAGPYADVIVKRILSIQQKNSWRNGFGFIDYALRQIKNKKKLFAKYSNQLLDCPLTDIYSFSLATISDPGKYKKRIIDDMLNDQNRCQIAFHFLCSHFPDEKQHFMTLIVNQIKQQKNIHYIYTFAYVLHKSGYDGHDFDNWLMELADNAPGLFEHSSLNTLFCLNPDPDMVVEKLLPLIKNGSRISGEFASLILKCSPKNKPIALDFILASYENTNNYGIFHPILPRILLSEKPDLYKSVFFALAANYAKGLPNNPKWMSYYVVKVIPPFAKVAKTNPEARKFFDKILDGENPAHRAIAATILVQADSKDKKATDTIEKFIIDGKEPAGLECLLWKAALGLSWPPTKTAAILEHILKNSESKWKTLGSSYGNVLKKLNHNYAAAIPIILKTLQNDKALPNNHKAALFNTLLQIDKANPDVLKIFMESILNPKKADDNLALNLIEALNDKHIEILIPQSRFASIKDKNISAKFAVQAIKNSDKNIPAAMPTLKKALNEDALMEWPIWFLMMKSEKLRQALLPLVSEAFLNAHLDSKNLLNIIKQFPSHLETIAPKLLDTYKAATSPEIIDNLTYLAAFIPAESAKPFAEIAEKRYADTKAPEKKLLLHFLLARVAPDKTTRDENANAFFASLGKKPVPEGWLGNAIVDSARLNAYPNLQKKFLNKMLASRPYNQQESAYWAILTLYPTPKFAEDALARQIEKLARYLKNPNTGANVYPDPLMKTLRDRPELGLKFLDKLKAIPEELRNDDIQETIKVLEAAKAKAAKTEEAAPPINPSTSEDTP